MIERTIQRRCVRYAEIGKAYRRWYRVARAVIRRLSDHSLSASGATLHDIPVLRRVETFERLCDIVAITSPRCSVVRNLRVAWAEFNAGERAADMIRSTRIALDWYYTSGEIRGAKTSRFAKVLRGDDSIVVIDTWMARGFGVADNQARNKSTQLLGERIIDRVRRTVSRRGIRFATWTMAETQAAVWAGIIRTHYNAGKIPVMTTQAVGLHRIDGALSEIPF